MSDKAGVFVNARGGSIAGIIKRTRNAATVTNADALYAGQRQRTRILERTAKHVDADGSPFEPYGTKLFYYSPFGKLSTTARGSLTDKQKRRRVKDLFRKVSAAGVKGVKAMGGAPYVTKSGMSIAFPGGYAQFKKWLGRSGVDLRSATGPHMLQAILIKIGSGGDSAASDMRIGIYDDFGARAFWNNAGRGVPKRNFFKVGRGDMKEMTEDILTRMRARLKA